MLARHKSGLKVVVCARTRILLSLYVQDTSTFSSNDEDPSLENHKRVGKWRKKWQDRDVLSEEITDWVAMNKYKPANLYGNIKTHSEGWPYRFIMSSKGTATENLAKWIEYHLKPFAQLHQAYIRDTKSFLLYLEEINCTRAPFGPKTRLISWDIKNYYPSCDTEMCIKAVEKVVAQYPGHVVEVPLGCILEALRITMSTNTGTQINRATIGGPEPASVTDIFGAVYIDPKAIQAGVKNWKRYRDDTLDIEENWDSQKVKEFTKYLNESVLKDKIKFEEESSGHELVFMDTKVHLTDGYLVPEIYSRPTDAHEYLSPDSAHPPMVTNGNPYAVALRVWRNCSDRFEMMSYLCAT